MQQLRNWWEDHYGTGTPIAHILRQQIPQRWLRIHSLPKSKRYADTPNEYSILFSRHHAVAAEVLGIQSLCYLFVGRYSEHAEWDIHSQDLPEIEGVDFTLFGSSVEPAPIRIWSAPVKWSAEQFSHLIKAVADDQEANVLFANRETGEAYAPYDGGADVFVCSSSRRDELTGRFSPWLSQHPQGL